MQKTCTACGVSYEGGRYSQFCAPCRAKKRGNRRRWFFTPEQDEVIKKRYDPRKRGAVAAIAEILKLPKWVITRRARALGLVRERIRQYWTKEEDNFLKKWAGERSVGWIRAQLKRGENSVITRIKRLKLSRTLLSDGYTLKELEQCFGIGHHAIERWVVRGYLKKRMNEQGTWNISEASILTFVICYPAEYDLRRVDQVWFKGLIADVLLLKEVLQTRAKTLQEAA